MGTCCSKDESSTDDDEKKKLRTRLLEGGAGEPAPATTPAPEREAMSARVTGALHSTSVGLERAREMQDKAQSLLDQFNGTLGATGDCHQGVTFTGSVGQICGGRDNWGKTSMEAWRLA